MLPEACLFDIGNVLLRFSHERMERQLGEVLGLDALHVRKILQKDKLQWRYEAGELSTQEVLTILKAQSGRPCDDRDVVKAACDIFEENEEMLPILAELKAAGVKLVLVSNTNEAHMSWCRGWAQFFHYFDAAVFSYEVRAMKPERAFYEAAQRVAGLDPSRCFFTDDLPENVEAARRFGFRGHLFTGANALRAELGLA